MTMIPKQIQKPGLTAHERRVRSMMIGFGQDTPDDPRIPDEKTRILRVRLLMEEVLEFAEAASVRVLVSGAFLEGAYNSEADESVPARLEFADLEFRRGDAAPSLALMVDGLSDISVVNTGAFVACGVQMTPMLELTDENNLMKLANGKLDEHGKFQKPANHPAPNYDFALALQGYKKPPTEAAKLADLVSDLVAAPQKTAAQEAVLEAAVTKELPPEMSELTRSLATWEADSKAAAAQESVIKPRIDSHKLLHTLWTKAVHTERYDKAEWIALEWLLAAAQYKLEGVPESVAAMMVEEDAKVRASINTTTFIGERAFAKEEIAAELRALENWRWSATMCLRVVESSHAAQPTTWLVFDVDDDLVDAGDTPEEALSNARDTVEGRRVPPELPPTGPDLPPTEPVQLTRLNDREYVYRGSRVDAIHAALGTPAAVPMLVEALGPACDEGGLSFNSASLRITTYKDAGPRGIAYKLTKPIVR